mmetsp:Transcript_30718/g.56922  ORF Transcript_30718/g.56922 Transcript_30718/m.56922 type:complete len:123 (+) Transcript_30718:487-855(+)
MIGLPGLVVDVDHGFTGLNDEIDNGVGSMWTSEVSFGGLRVIWRRGTLVDVVVVVRSVVIVTAVAIAFDADCLADVGMAVEGLASAATSKRAPLAGAEEWHGDIGRIGYVTVTVDLFVPVKW